MQIIFNGEAREVDSGTTVSTLLQTMELDARRVAVEINEELAPRDRHGERLLQEGDQLEVVTLVGGG